MSDSRAAWSPPPLVFLPERKEPQDTLRARLQGAVSGWFSRITIWHRVADRQLAVAAIAYGKALRELPDQALDTRLAELREQLRCNGLQRSAVRNTLAVLRELVHRELGLSLTRAQLQAAQGLLSGRLVVLAPGEGKTLALIIAALVRVFAGLPVHIVVANEYLLRRDSTVAGAIFSRCAVSMGVVLGGANDEQRRCAYDADIVYACSSALAYDYLRDRMRLGGPSRNVAMKLRRLQTSSPGPRVTMMRGLHFALVDDADLVMLDQANTPMVITRQTDPVAERSWATRAWELSAQLEADSDFEVDRRKGAVKLSEQGSAKLEHLCAGDGGVWGSVLRREDAVRQALEARHVFQRDRHYTVSDGRIRIVDVRTGGVVTDRSWSGGLHQLLEVKEGCEVTGRSMPASRIGFQRLFQRYQNVSGITSSAARIRREMWKTYGLSLERIQPTHASEFKRGRRRIWPTDETMLHAVAAEITETERSGRPVLVSVGTFQQSAVLQQALAKVGLRAVVVEKDTPSTLQLLESAFSQANITIVIGLVGAGVEVAVDQKIADLGGAHLVLVGCRNALRLEERLIGLVMRRGRPGSVSVNFSMEDPLLKIVRDTIPARILRALRLEYASAGWLMDWAQRRAEHLHATARYELVQRDRKLTGFLAFSGSNE